MEAKNRIKIALAEKDMQVKVLAKGIKASPVTVSRWVNNRQQPSIQKLYDVAVFLEYDVTKLLVSNIGIENKD